MANLERESFSLCIDETVGLLKLLVAALLELLTLLILPMMTFAAKVGSAFGVSLGTGLLLRSWLCQGFVSLSSAPFLEPLASTNRLFFCK